MGSKKKQSSKKPAKQSSAPMSMDPRYSSQNTQFDPQQGLRFSDSLKYYELNPKTDDQLRYNSFMADSLRPGQTSNTQTNNQLGALRNQGDYYTTGAQLGRGTTWQWNRNQDLQNAASQFNQLGGRLAQGPQNAFSRQDMEQMRAMGLQQLQRASQQAMRGVAGAASSRGVGGGLNAGTALGGMLNAGNRSALAQADLEQRMAGMEAGRANYGAMNAAAGTLGNMAQYQDSRDLETQKLDYARREENRGRMYQDYVNAQNALDQFRQQYAIQMSRYADNKGKKSKYKADTEALRNQMAEMIRDYNIKRQMYMESAM